MYIIYRSVCPEWYSCTIYMYITDYQVKLYHPCCQQPLLCINFDTVSMSLRSTRNREKVFELTGTMSIKL